MRTIWKYPVTTAPVQQLHLPDGAVIRHVGDQDGTICLWVEVDPDNILVSYTVQIVGTGQRCPHTDTYIGTVHSGAFVWHVYGSSP